MENFASGIQGILEPQRPILGLSVKHSGELLPNGTILAICRSNYVENLPNQ